MGKGNLDIVLENQQAKQKKKKKKNKNKKLNKPHQPHLIEVLTEPKPSLPEQTQIKQQQKIHHKIILNQQQRMQHLAICFPDSILEIPQNSDLRAYFVSEVARICSIFKVDEIIILRDHAYKSKSENFKPTEYLVRNLQYLETPQYLRKYLFKMHPDLQKAGLMNPIQCPHHLKSHQICEYREGVTLDRPTKKGAGSWVDIGLSKQAQITNLLLPNTRITVQLQNYEQTEPNLFIGQPVSKKMPRQEKNLYWGYDVRIANNITEMIEGGEKQYEIKILCNHHERVNELKTISDFDDVTVNDKSMIIFYSGTDDLSTLIAKDEKARLNVSQAYEMFDFSFAFENFGVQKMRIEEQMFMSLTKLSRFIQ